eukprot:370712_1
MALEIKNFHNKKKLKLLQSVSRFKTGDKSQSTRVRDTVIAFLSYISGHSYVAKAIFDMVLCFYALPICIRYEKRIKHFLCCPFTDSWNQMDLKNVVCVTFGISLGATLRFTTEDSPIDEWKPHTWAETDIFDVRVIEGIEQILITEGIETKIFQYLDLCSILQCERSCHFFCRVTSNHPECFTNFKYSFCPSNRSYMFRHYQRLYGSNDPFYRFRHSTKMHLSFWSKENYEFRLLTAFGHRFRNVRSLTIEVNRKSPLVDLSQLVKKYSNFFVSIRSVVICVHGLGQPHPNPHNRMITLYKSLISFILIRCSFIRTLTLNYSLLTQCYRHVSSCLELTQILCINSKSQLFNDHKQIEDDDYSNIIIFKMNNSVNDIVNDALPLPPPNTAHTTDNDDHHHPSAHNSRHHRHHSRHHSRHRHHRRSHRSSRSSRETKADPGGDDVDDNKMKIIKLGNIETQIQREIKIIFYRRHVRYSFLSYFHNHIRSIHVHNAMGFSNDIESPESRRLNLDTSFGEYEFLEEMCLCNVSNKISAFVNSHCRSCPMLNKMNVIFDSNKNVYNADQLYKTMKVLLFTASASSNSTTIASAAFRFGMTQQMVQSGPDSNDNSDHNNSAAANEIDIAKLGLDYEGDVADNKTDSADNSSVQTEDAMTQQQQQQIYSGYHRRGLIPKMMRKYLNIITLNCDMSSNVKLLSHLEKTFEMIASDMNISTTQEMNALLLRLNLFVHIHIDVECHNTDEIKKLLQLLKHKYFQCDYTSYHVIARKLNVVSNTSKKAPKSPPPIHQRNSKSKFTFSNDDDEKESNLKEAKETMDLTPRSDNMDLTPVQHKVQQGMQQQAAAAVVCGVQQEDDSAGPTLISPSILHRRQMQAEEIDDGNKSDGGNSSNQGSGINFKEAMSKMKLFGNKVHRLIKSNSTESEPHTINNEDHHYYESKEDETHHKHQRIGSPNQVLRFMKKATIHCDDIEWICDCKYAQCSRKYRTLYK